MPTINYENNDREMEKYIKDCIFIEPNIKPFTRTLRTFYIRSTNRYPTMRPSVVNGISYGLRQKLIWETLNNSCPSTL